MEAEVNTTIRWNRRTRVWALPLCASGDPKTPIRPQKPRQCHSLPTPLSLAADLHDDPAVARAGVEVDQDDLLPGSEGEVAVDQGDGQAGADE